MLNSICGVDGAGLGRVVQLISHCVSSVRQSSLVIRSKADWRMGMPGAIFKARTSAIKRLEKNDKFKTDVGLYC